MRIVMGGVEYQVTPDGAVTPDGPIAEWASAMLTSDEPVGPQVDEYAGVRGTPEDYPQSAVAVFRDIADWTQLAITNTTFDEQPVTAAIDKGGFDELGNWHDPGSGEFAKKGMSTAKAAALRLWRAMINVAETRPDGVPAVVTRGYPGVPNGHRSRARFADADHANIDVGDRTIRVPWMALQPASDVVVQNSGEPTRARARSMSNYETSFLVRRLAETHAVIAQGGTPGTSRSKFEDDTIERANIVKELLVRGVTPDPAHLTDWQNENLSLLRERALADPTPHRRQPRKPPTTTPYASVEPEGKPVKLTPDTPTAPTTQDMVVAPDQNLTEYITPGVERWAKKLAADPNFYGENPDGDVIDGRAVAAVAVDAWDENRTGDTAAQLWEAVTSQIPSRLWINDALTSPNPDPDAIETLRQAHRAAVDDIGDSTHYYIRSVSSMNPQDISGYGVIMAGRLQLDSGIRSWQRTADPRFIQEQGMYGTVAHGANIGQDRILANIGDMHDYGEYLIADTPETIDRLMAGVFPVVPDAKPIGETFAAERSQGDRAADVLQQIRKRAPAVAGPFVDRTMDMLRHVEKNGTNIGDELPSRLRLKRVAKQWPLSGSIFVERVDTGTTWRLHLKQGGRKPGWKVELVDTPPREAPTTQDMAGPTISGKADWYTTTVDGQTVAPHTRTAIAPKWITVAQDQPGDVWSPVGFSTADTREEALAHAEADAPGAAAWNVGEATVSPEAPPATVRVTERPFMQKEPGGEDSGFVAYKTVAVNDNPAGVIRKVEDTGTWEAIDRHWNVIAEFDTVNEARDAIAEAYADVRQRDTDGTVTDNAVETWRIGDIQAKAAKLNDRAEKKGLSGRVEVTVGEPRLIPRYNENGIEIGVTEVAAVTVSTTPVVLPGGWEYAGVIDYAATEGADNGLLHSASGYQLPTEFAGAAICDDCGRSMPRNKLIVAADTDGNLTRLGTTCVKDVLGYDPAKLLWWANILDDFDFEDGEERVSGASASPSWRKESFLATAQLAVDKYGYTKTSEPDSTKELVTRVWERASKMDSVRLKEFREYMTGMHDTPEWEAAKAKAAEIEAHINSDAFPGRNEFEQNIINAISLTHVNKKTAGILAYAPMILARFNNDAAERAAKKTVPNEWIGQIGDKPELTGTVRGVTKIDGQYGITVLLAIDTDQGVVKVFASGGSEFANAGQDAYETKTPISFVGTIKDHDIYPRGSDAKQTILTRVKPITTFADRLRDRQAQVVENMHRYQFGDMYRFIGQASADDDWRLETRKAVLFDVSEARGLEIQDAVNEFKATLAPQTTTYGTGTPLDDAQRSQLREFIQQQLDTSEPAQVDWLTPELIDNADLPITGFEFGKTKKKAYTIEPGGNVRDESTGKRLTDKSAEPILRAALIAANPTLAEQIPEDPTANMTRLEKLRAAPKPDTDLSYQTVNAARSLTQRAYDKSLSKARGDDPETLLAGLTGKEQAALFKVLGERRVADQSTKYADPGSYRTFNADVFPAPGATLDVFDLRTERRRPPVGSRLGYMQRSDTNVADQTVFTVTDTGIADPDGIVTTWDMLDAEWETHLVADKARGEWERRNRYRSQYTSSDPGSVAEPPKPVTRKLMVLSRPDISTPWQDNGSETIEIQEGTGPDAPTVPYVFHGDGTVTTVDGVPVTGRPAAFYNHFFNRSMYNATQQFLDDHDKANGVWVREQVTEIKAKRTATDQLTSEMIEAAPLPMDFAYGDKGTLYHITSGGDVFNAKTKKQVASQTTADKILLAAITAPEAPITQDMAARPVHGSKVIEGTLGQVDRAPFTALSEAYNTDSGTVQTAAREAFGFTGNTDAATPDVRMLTDLHVATQAVLSANGIQPSDEVTLYRPLDINEFDEWVDAGHPNRMKTAPLASYVAQDNADMRTVTVQIPAGNIVSLGTIGAPDEIVAFPPDGGVPITRYNPPTTIPVGTVVTVNGVKIQRTPSGFINVATGEPVHADGTPI